MNRIDLAHSLRPRLEGLMEAQQKLRRAHNDTHMEFELERAIGSLSIGEPDSQSDAAERWAHEYLAGAS